MTDAIETMCKRVLDFKKLTHYTLDTYADLVLLAPKIAEYCLKQMAVVEAAKQLESEYLGFQRNNTSSIDYVATMRDRLIRGFKNTDTLTDLARALAALEKVADNKPDL